MGSPDWADLNNSLNSADLKRGVTAGITPPPGGTNFVYAHNSLSDGAAGAHGKYVNLTDFDPTGTGPSSADGGGEVRGALIRLSSPGKTLFSPTLFFCAQGTPSVNDNAYLLGLSDEDPYRIVLAKGPISSPLIEDDENVSILARSSAQFDMADQNWHHLRLACIVQPNGDVLLKCYANDLTANPLGGAFVWAAIPGISDYIDDAVHINSGSAPLWGGYAGFAFAINNALNRRAAFKAMQVYRVT